MFLLTLVSYNCIYEKKIKIEIFHKFFLIKSPKYFKHKNYYQNEKNYSTLIDVFDNIFCFFSRIV